MLHLPEAYNRVVHPGSLTIVMYHGVIDAPLDLEDWCFLQKDEFRRQINYIKKKFALVTLQDGVRMLKERQIKKPAAAITFDDGFLNNYEIALPIMAKTEVPATVFLTTSLVNTESTVWFCKLIRALASTEKKMIRFKSVSYDLKDEAKKAESSARLQGVFKEVKFRDFKMELESIITELGDDINHPVEKFSPFRMLHREAIRHMVDSGLIDFGAHTHSHAILASLPGSLKRMEIDKSIKAVEEFTGKKCVSFAYPNGQPQDYDKECIEILSANGIRAAVTTIPGPNTPNTSCYELRRYGIGADTNFERFKCLVHHLKTSLKI